MNLIKQTLLGLVAIVAALAIWALYVPSAAPVLDRIGLYDLIGMDPPVAEEAGGGGGGRFGGGAARVVVAEVGTGQANARVLAVGDGRAARSVTVRAEVAGLIRELAVTSGAEVAAGAVLARLDDEAEHIALERAELVLANAQADLDRIRQLSAAGTVSDVQLREAELAFRSAELELDQARLDLAQRQVLAPISGWVGLLEVEEGDRIGAQDALAVITDRATILIEFRVPERHIAQLSVGMPLAVSPVARQDVVLAGEIVALDNVVDRESRTLRVQGRVANADDSLRAGQAFEVALSFPGDTLPSVDPLAIQWSGDGAFVWVAREGTAVRVPVVIRQRNSDSVLVEGELTPGETVIVEGVQALRPGGAVEIVSGAPAAAGDTAAAGGTQGI